MVVNKRVRILKKMFVGIVDWFLYTLMSESQKKTLSGLIPEKQKNKLKEMTKYGKRQAQRTLVKKIKHHLYNLGFTEKPLLALENLHLNTEDPYLKRLTAWELSLWHANKYSREGALQALKYLEISSDGEKNKEQLRKLAIVQAECYDILGDKEMGQQTIQTELTREPHPDLYLAVANLEESIDQRVKWVNQMMAHYGLHPITFVGNETTITYDDLRTMPLNRKITEGPKVSVILPAFNFEDGIHIAIESILSQTWKNIELLIVDDCSTDNTVKVIQSYMEKDERIKLFSTPENSGPYIARNIALREATGEYVTVNDADDWSHAEKIEIQVKHLIDHETIIANTSEHARLTDELKFYRRGTPGIYIFPNMSSLMFRREPVMERLGFWDSVRFAADGEFKRRLIRAFGRQSIVDLKTGPLSLPRQSVSSLTGSSAFGYNGFFMGARKEYVESLEYHHNRAESLYYPYPQVERPFPVPEPMWPKREEKPDGSRHFDVVIAGDFRSMTDVENDLNTLKKLKKRIGLVQINRYELEIGEGISQSIRKIIDGDQVQMLVYGERIKADKLFFINHLILEEHQRYIADLESAHIHVLVNELPNQEHKTFEHADQLINEYAGSTGIWHPDTLEIKKCLTRDLENGNHKVNLANEIWESMVQYVE